MENNMEQRLWDHIDGINTAAEAAAIRLLIDTNPAWNQQYTAMLAMNEELAELMEPDNATAGFTDSVMLRIATEQNAVPAKKTLSIPKGIAAVFVACICCSIAAAIIYYQPEETSTGSWWSDIHVPDFRMPHFAPELLSTLAVSAIALLTLVLFDVAIRTRRVTG